MAKPGESRQERFVRLAEKRTRRALDDIRLIGNLSNESNYAWTADQVERIFDALESEVRAARARFSVDGFSLE